MKKKGKGSIRQMAGGVCTDTVFIELCRENV